MIFSRLSLQWNILRSTHQTLARCCILSNEHLSTSSQSENVSPAQRRGLHLTTDSHRLWPLAVDKFDSEINTNMSHTRTTTTIHVKLHSMLAVIHSSGSVSTHRFTRNWKFSYRLYHNFIHCFQTWDVNASTSITPQYHHTAQQQKVSRSVGHSSNDGVWCCNRVWNGVVSLKNS